MSLTRCNGNDDDRDRDRDEDEDDNNNRSNRALRRIIRLLDDLDCEDLRLLDRIVDCRICRRCR